MELTTFTIVNDTRKYALINYVEIIEYYKLPFYKKWFKKPPVREFVEIKQ